MSFKVVNYFTEDSFIKNELYPFFDALDIGNERFYYRLFERLHNKGAIRISLGGYYSWDDDIISEDMLWTATINIMKTNLQDRIF